MKKGSHEYLQLIATDPDTKKIEKAGRFMGGAGFLGMMSLVATEALVSMTSPAEISRYLIPLAIIAPVSLCLLRAGERFRESEKILDRKMGPGFFDK
jgi:hypothetical protein